MIDSFNFDVAVGEDCGKRRTQEDFVFANFPESGNAGLAVLSDGMGGHRDSIIAAKFLVTGVAGELSAELDNFAEMEEDMPERLESLTRFANLQLGSYIQQRGIKRTIGATLLSVAISRNKLFWASVGDSLLYLVRDNEIMRLNADHSMSPQIDFMVEAGMISAENATDHPDRNILTSAIYGRNIKKIDCPRSHFELKGGDVVLLASDGLDSLGSDRTLGIIRDCNDSGSGEIVRQILRSIELADTADQDNTALVAVRVFDARREQSFKDPMKVEAPATPWSLGLKEDPAPCEGT